MADEAPERDEQPGARPFWSGTITFGLVSIPVGLLPASRGGGVALRMLAPDGTPVSRRYVCPREGIPVEGGEIVRGREVDGDWVTVTDEELEGLEPRKSRDIDLREFVPVDAIPPLYFERAYFLAPAGQSTKAYRLLAAIMERSGRAGIATFVMRGREYLVAILARGGILGAETLRFADELRTPEDVGLPAPAPAKGARARALERALDALAGDGIPRDALVDRQAEAIRALAARKRERGEDVVEAPETPSEEEPVDLVAAIRASLHRRGGRAEPAPARRAGGRRLERASKAELLERAKALDIEDRSRMTKEQLARAIRARERAA